MAPSATWTGIVCAGQVASSATMLTDQIPSKSFADAVAELAAAASTRTANVDHRRENGSTIVNLSDVAD
jgi:hypothetical protein